MANKSVSSGCIDLFIKLSNFVRPIGGNIMDTGEDSPPNKRTYIMMCLLVTYVIMSFTSIYHFRKDFIELAFALVTFGFSIQSIVKVYVIIVCMNKIRRIIYASGDFIQIFEVNRKVCDLFAKYIKFCNFCNPLVQRFYAVAGTSIILIPVIISVWTNTKLLPYGTVIPFVDYKSDIGYGIHFGYMVTITVYGIYGLFASDYGYLCTMAMACGQVETIGVLCEDLTIYLELYGQDNKEEIHKLITYIVIAQQSHTK